LEQNVKHLTALKIFKLGSGNPRIVLTIISSVKPALALTTVDLKMDHAPMRENVKMMNASQMNFSKAMLLTHALQQNQKMTQLLMTHVLQNQENHFKILSWAEQCVLLRTTEML
jgi:hypothetical protein